MDYMSLSFHGALILAVIWLAHRMTALEEKVIDCFKAQIVDKQDEKP
jgi:hypothetical protein